MKHHVVAILKGGLGNQMFAYAAARAFALRAGRVLWIDDTSGFARDGYGRVFRLGGFSLAAQPAPVAARLGDPKGLRHKTVRALDRLLPHAWRAYVAEDPARDASQLLGFSSRRAVVHLNGYWQREEYFADHAEAIRHELDPPALAGEDLRREEQAAGSESVFVHIRRQRYSPRLGADYYHRAIQAAREVLPGCRFLVFGDDPAWARAHLDFGSAPVSFEEEPGASELRDLRLMAACRHAIVANSSFSWWAAWLRPRSDKIVWTPADPGWPVKPAAAWIPVANSLEIDSGGPLPGKQPP